MAHVCKEMVSTDGITVGVMCGHFLDDEPWDVGVDAETYFRQLDEAVKREADVATDRSDETSGSGSRGDTEGFAPLR